ncbi:MAG: hypothetical protein WCA04_14495 [Geobacteraceae bacterium]
MKRSVFPLLFLLLLSACSQTVRISKVADTFEIEVHDDGTTSLLNSSILNRDWEEQAKQLCPKGYDVIRQQYYKEEPFSPARIVGAVRCR